VVESHNRCSWQVRIAHCCWKHCACSESRLGKNLMSLNRCNIELWLTYSDDDGDTWAHPLRLSELERFAWTWVGFGPPASLQLSSGRIIVPMYFSSAPIYDNGLLTSAIALSSDDDGEIWQLSSTVPNGFMGAVRGITSNECQVIELADGFLLMNSRTLFGNRIQSQSFDDGDTWTQMERTILPNPLIGCEGSIAVEQDDFLLHTGSVGPGNKAKRVRMTLFESSDEGDSWNEKQVLQEDGSVSYSALWKFLDGRMVVFFELSTEIKTVFIPGKMVLEFLDTGRQTPCATILHPECKRLSPDPK